jgi:hypothetical protein
MLSAATKYDERSESFLFLIEAESTSKSYIISTQPASFEKSNR